MQKSTLQLCSAALSLMLISLCWTEAAAQRAGRSITVVMQPPTLSESMQVSVDTVGEAFVGLVGGPIGNNLASTDIVVSGIRPTDRMLCVRIQKSSGLYSATFQYSIRQIADEIRFNIRFRHLSRANLSGELAIRAQASASDRCNSAAPFLPVRWASSQLAGNVILFNSRQATEVSAQTEAGEFVSCESLRSATGKDSLSIRSFDTVCYVPAVRRCGVAQRIRVNRADGLEYDRPQTLVIRSPC